MTAKYNKALKPTQLEFRYLVGSVVVLGKYGEKAALPLLTDIARSSEDASLDLRIFAVQSIGEIDADANRDLLVQELKDDDFGIRRSAATGLSTINDRDIMFELDVAASREISPNARREMQALADGLRTRLSVPASPPK